MQHRMRAMWLERIASWLLAWKASWLGISTSWIWA
jgi:hypothetical protein